jgi:hypothetical protein
MVKPLMILFLVMVVKWFSRNWFWFSHVLKLLTRRNPFGYCIKNYFKQLPDKKYLSNQLEMDAADKDFNK